MAKSMQALWTSVDRCHADLLIPPDSLLDEVLSAESRVAGTAVQTVVSALAADGR